MTSPYRDMPREALEAEIVRLQAEVVRLQRATLWERFREWMRPAKRLPREPVIMSADITWLSKDGQHTFLRHKDVLYARRTEKWLVYPSLAGTEWVLVDAGIPVPEVVGRRLGEIMVDKMRAAEAKALSAHLRAEAGLG